MQVNQLLLTYNDDDFFAAERDSAFISSPCSRSDFGYFGTTELLGPGVTGAVTSTVLEY